MKKIIACFAAASLLTSCASIISDSNYPVNFVGQDGVEFEIRNQSGLKIHKGTTPSVVNLEASAGYFDDERYTVTTADGNTRILNTEIDGWYIANILFGGVIGLLIIDPATGAMYKLPESFYVDGIAPVAAATPKKSNSPTSRKSGVRR